MKRVRSRKVSKPRKPRVSGVAWPVTDEWKQSVRNWLRDNRVERQAFADLIDVDKSAVTQLLSETKPQYTSRLVPAICDLTKLPPPTISFGDQRIKDLLEWAYIERVRDPANFTRLIGIILHTDEASAKKARAEEEQKEAQRQLEEEIAKIPRGPEDKES
jgi:predicted transcriptional regulator